MTYIQANFCNSMVDMDLFFLQICATQLPAHTFLSTAIDVFGVTDWLSMGSLLAERISTTTANQELEQDTMLEGLMTFLATLITSRTNLGNTEPAQCKIEIAALLATGDKTHSQLLELMPERSGNAHTRNFERFLKELSVFRRPPIGSENLDQGLFMPVPDVWERYYDPLHVLLRAVHRRDFQNSMDRYTVYVRDDGRLPKSGSLWPPFRLPEPVGFGYSDPACILQSRVLHAALLSILYRAVHSNNVTEHLLSLAVFLLEVAVAAAAQDAQRTGGQTSTTLEARRTKPSGRTAAGVDGHDDDDDDDCDIDDDDENGDGVSGAGGAGSGGSAAASPVLLHCFPGDCLVENLRHTVQRITLAPLEPQVSPAQYNTPPFDSDLEWDISESDSLPMLVDRDPYALAAVGPATAAAAAVAAAAATAAAAASSSSSSTQRTLALGPAGMEVTSYPQDLSVVRGGGSVGEQTLVRRRDSSDDESDMHIDEDDDADDDADDDDDVIMPAQSLPQLTLGESTTPSPFASPYLPPSSLLALAPPVPTLTPASSTASGMELAEIHRELRVPVNPASPSSVQSPSSASSGSSASSSNVHTTSLLYATSTSTSSAGSLSGRVAGQHPQIMPPPPPAATDVSAGANANGVANPGNMLLPFLRGQTVANVAAAANYTMDMVPATGNNTAHGTVSVPGSSGSGATAAGGSRRHHHYHHHHHYHASSGARKQKPIDAVPGAGADTVPINESIISLLLKLHSQLSGTLDSFTLDAGEGMDTTGATGSSSTAANDDSSSATSATASDSDAGTAAPSTSAPLPAPPTSARDRSRIGDGPHFVGALLRRIARLDRACAQTINDIRERTWPNQRERIAEQAAREQREKEDRSRRAKERQQKLMEEFAKKQRRFMELAEGMDLDGDGGDSTTATQRTDGADLSASAAAASSLAGAAGGVGGGAADTSFGERLRDKEYVCIICNNTSPSTESNPIGLVVLVESSGVIGHRRKPGERFALPLCDDDQNRPHRHVRLSSEFTRRTELLAMKFGEESWFLSNNMAYESGVHVQTCGHHVHLACHDSYLNSLYTSQRHHNLNVDRGEFSCPVCRQLSNSVLPLSPQLDRAAPVVRSPPPEFAEVVQELTLLIRDNERPQVNERTINCRMREG